MTSCDYIQRLKKVESLKTLYRDMGFEGDPGHPFNEGFMEKALSKMLPWQKRVIERRYIQNKTVKETSGLENIPIWAMETIEMEITEKMRNLYTYPWML